MPYQWTDTEAPQRLTLWPHRSLTPQGFATFIAITATMFLLPLLAVLGSPVLWGLLPFLVGAVWAVWYGLRRNGEEARLLREELSLADDRIALVRTDPRGQVRTWEANPYWVEVALHEDGGPVPNYVTLRGSDRTVEIGAFLSPEERKALYRDLQDRIRRLGRAHP